MSSPQISESRGISPSEADRKPADRHVADRYGFQPAESAKLNAAPAQAHDFAARALLPAELHEGRVLLISSGCIARSHNLRSGVRQVVQFLLPGEIVIPDTEPHNWPANAYEVLVPTTVLELAGQPGEMREICHIAAVKDMEALRETVVDLGRRSAVERMARMLLRMDRHLNASLVEGKPRRGVTLTQAAIADHLGLSLVHTNRTLKTLKANGVITVEHGLITVVDPTRLAKFAEGAEPAAA